MCEGGVELGGSKQGGDGVANPTTPSMKRLVLTKPSTLFFVVCKTTKKVTHSQPPSAFHITVEPPPPSRASNQAPYAQRDHGRR